MFVNLFTPDKTESIFYGIIFVRIYILLSLPTSRTSSLVGIANSSSVATIPRTPLASKITFSQPRASTHPLHKNTQSTCYPCPTPSLSCSWLAILLDGFAQLNIHAGHRKCRNRKREENASPMNL
jgi:hypothetical protein